MAQDSGYAFKVINETGAATTVSVDGKPVCDNVAAGGSCTVMIKDADPHNFAYTAGGAAKTFEPGNLELVEVCKLGASGAHCVDPTGAATN